MSVLLLILCASGYLGAVAASLVGLRALAGVASGADVYPRGSLVWQVARRDWPSGLSAPVHEPETYESARLLLFTSQILLLVAVVMFFIEARRTAGVAEQARREVRASLVPVANWRMTGAGLIGLAEAITNRPLSPAERLAVRSWVVGTLIVVALTGFADIPGYGSSALDGTPVSAIRQALETAIAASAAGIALVTLTLMIALKTGVVARSQAAAVSA